eukprot:4135212-Alexandrium_andersonii.AAC.1
MSASLVGSEMCIRDRPPSCHLRRAPGLLRALAVAVCWLATSCGRRAGSVSYTHLTLPTICSV